MDCLRIKLTQKKAHYRKEESIDNKMTYPLPPISTVIGMLHAACSYTEYHPMDISIQGKYGSMQREVYRDHAILNSVMDDRGILVKVPNPTVYNDAYHVVATALKSQGNSFRKNETIRIEDSEGYTEYVNLLNRRDELAIEKKELVDVELGALKKEKKEKKEEQKKFDKKSSEFLEIANSIKKIDSKIKEINDTYKKKKYEEYERPYSCFKSLTTSIRSYEVLNDVELILHIRAEENVLQDIEENKNNIISLGRSEDFVEVMEVSRVKLDHSIKESHQILKEKDIQINRLSGYIPLEVLQEKVVNLSLKKVEEVHSPGTKYYLNKNYKIIDGKRIFNKKWVVYAEGYQVSERRQNENVRIDTEGAYVVAFL